MKLFACKSFSGHYLSGCAVVVADSEDEAKRMLAVELAGQGLSAHNLPSELALKEISLDSLSVNVLFNGDY